MNQANGKPATKSREATKRPIANEANIADEALDIKSGLWKICPMAFHLRIIPRMGGIRIIPKKKIRELE